ncbi:hypothetical protein diail_7276 [Diaporthe ilicicola]|nr:hypothetical protein diail_7276 [Diaporthe ilicicola]
MAPTVPFYRFLCLVLWLSLAYHTVCAKPLKLSALSQRRYMSNLSHIVGVTEALCDKNTDHVDDHPPATLVIGMPTCIDDGRCASGCMITDVAAVQPTHICAPPLYCSLDGEGADATFSCYTQGTETVKLDLLSPISTDQNVAPFMPHLHQEYFTAPVYASPPEVMSTVDMDDPPPASTFVSIPIEQITVTMNVVQGTGAEPDGTIMLPVSTGAPGAVPGRATVYVTLTDDDPSSPTATAPAKAEPNYTNDPEPNKTVIILGSIFGFITVLGILIVYVDRLRRRKRLQRQELQQLQERPASTSSVEDESELLRQQQQRYGYYGTQRILSAGIAPQEIKAFPSGSEPAELATPKDETVETERRDGH